MSKLNSVVTFKGRTGNVVGAKGYKGSTILRAYQPTVANPNTTKQRKQRTKFYAATNLANLLPPVCLAGMRPLAKSVGCSARNALSRTLLRMKDLYTTTQTGSEITVVPDYNRIQFSKGFVPLPNFMIQSAQDNPGELAGTIICPSNLNYANSRAIVVVVPEEESAMASVGVLGDSFTFEATGQDAGKANFLLAVPDAYTGLKCHVYAYVQNFDNDADATAYYNAVIAQSESDIVSLESQANYSNTVHCGRVTMA